MEGSSPYKIERGPNGCVAIVDTRRFDVFVPLHHYEKHTKEKRAMRRQHHFENQATSTIIATLKEDAPGVINPSAFNVTILKAAHVSDMYPTDEWLHELIDIVRVEESKKKNPDTPNAPFKKRGRPSEEEEKPEYQFVAAPPTPVVTKTIREEKKKKRNPTSTLTKRDLEEIRLIIRQELMQDFKKQAKEELLRELIRE